MLKGACPQAVDRNQNCTNLRSSIYMVAFENSKTNLLVLPRFFMFKIIGPSEILTKIKNILTHWSVAQAGLIDEENWR